VKREVRTVVVAEDAVVDSNEKELCSRSVLSNRIIACPNSDRKVLRYVSGNTTVIVGLATRLRHHSCDLGYNGATKVGLRPLDGRE
jgi:hypothetical protein